MLEYDRTLKDIATNARNRRLLLTVNDHRQTPFLTPSTHRLLHSLLKSTADKAKERDHAILHGHHLSELAADEAILSCLHQAAELELELEHEKAKEGLKHVAQLYKERGQRAARDKIIAELVENVLHAALVGQNISAALSGAQGLVAIVLPVSPVHEEEEDDEEEEEEPPAKRDIRVGA